MFLSNIFLSYSPAVRKNQVAGAVRQMVSRELLSGWEEPGTGMLVP